MKKQQTENWKKKFLNKIKVGDSSKLLKEIPDNQIQMVVTSPPYYNQRNYKGIGNEKKLENYLESIMEIFRECVRITKEKGSIVFNLGDKYENKGLLLVPYRFALKAIEEGEVKLVNNITWVKSNPTPRQYKRRLVNSTEPFFHFVKSDNYSYIRDNFMKEEDRKEKAKKIEKRENSKKGQKYFELIDKSELSAEEKKLAREELEETIRDYKEGEIEDFRMKIRGIHALPFGGKEGGRMTHLRKKGFTIIRMNGTKMKKDVIESSVETISGRDHPAIYPKFIIKELIKLLTKEGDIVLDPFMGSGTTALAAKELNREWIGIDINEKFCKNARERLKETKEKKTKKIEKEEKKQRDILEYSK